MRLQLKKINLIFKQIYLKFWIIGRTRALVVRMAVHNSNQSAIAAAYCWFAEHSIFSLR